MKSLISYCFVLIAFMMFLQCNSSKKTGGSEHKGVGKTIETSMGNIQILLYDETPMHRDNFINLCKKKHYNGVIFHRVIADFMIQTGDPSSKNATPGILYGKGDVSYTIPSEFNSKFFHKKGAIAAARLGDDINPEKESSGSQFYIVTGRIFSLSELKDLEAMMQTRNPGFTFSQEAIEAYTTIGGTPHLDGSYTVFGEVTNGMNLVENISHVPVNELDRPVKDVLIRKIK